MVELWWSVCLVQLRPMNASLENTTKEERREGELWSRRARATARESHPNYPRLPSYLRSYPDPTIPQQMLAALILTSYSSYTLDRHGANYNESNGMVYNHRDLRRAALSSAVITFGDVDASAGFSSILDPPKLLLAVSISTLLLSAVPL